MVRKVVISDLKCINCGQNFPIPRKVSNRRRGGHLKDIYCVWCKRKTKHIEKEPTKYN